jgi:hypothetical protein
MAASEQATREQATSSRRTRRGVGPRVAVIGAIWAISTLGSFAQGKPYTPKNGILNWKAVLLGGAFRVTTAIPLHGDFSRYARLEVVHAESVIGPDVPGALLEKLTLGLAEEFRKGERFSNIAIVDSFSPQPFHPLPSSTVVESFRDADPVDAPMRTWDDLVAFDRQRQATVARASNETLVVRCQVIDYARGNKFLQLLLLDLGDAILTLRISYFDKSSGEEVGRSVVSSNNASKGIPSAFSPRSELTGAIEGLVDQVTRRKIAGER